MTEEKRIIQIPATFTSMSNTKDGGKRLGFMTQELSVDEKMVLEEFYGEFGFLLFKSNEFADMDIPKEDAPEEGKTQSQRLRGVIWRRAEKKLGREPTNAEFNKAYYQRMEQLIEKEKEFLEGVDK